MVDAGFVLPGHRADVHEAADRTNLETPGWAAEGTEGDLDQMGGGHAGQHGQHDRGEDAAEGATAYCPPRP
jgi:hypothetical protein